MAYVVFENDGTISRCILVGPESRDMGIDIEAGTWYMATSYSQVCDQAAASKNLDLICCFGASCDAEFEQQRSVEIRTTFPGISELQLQAEEHLPGVPHQGSPEGKVAHPSHYPLSCSFCHYPS